MIVKKEKHICDYGCGQESKYQFKNGKWCCSKNIAQCSAVRKKMSKSQSGEKNHMFEKHHSEKSKNKIGISNIGKRKIPFENIKKYAEDKKYRILSKKEEYKDSISKLWFRCPEGHEFPMIWNNFKAGHICPYCANKKKRTPFKEIIKFVEDEGYQLLSKEADYKNQFSTLEFRCPEGHEFPARWDSFKSGNRCPICKGKRISKRMLNGGAAHSRSFIKKISKPHQELFNLVKEDHPEAKIEYPCFNYSIDIAIPNLKIAIEYDGSYWHQDQEKDDKRQREIENKGWTFLRYRDYIPSKEELKKDILKILKDTNL